MQLSKVLIATMSIAAILIVPRFGLADMNDEICLENNYIKAVFDGERNLILSGIWGKHESEKQSLLAEVELVFHYSDPEFGLIFNAEGRTQGFGEDAEEIAFKVTKHRISKDELTAHGEDKYFSFKKTFSLPEGRPYLAVDYYLKAREDIMLGPWNHLPKIRWSNMKYERFYPDYRVKDGEIEQVINSIVEQLKINNRPVIPTMKDWFGVFNPEENRGVLLFFPGCKGRSYLQRGGSYLEILPPFVDDKFIPKGETNNISLYLVPFKGSYEEAVKLWCKEFNIEYDNSMRKSVSDTGAVLRETENYALWYDFPTRKILEEEKPPSQRASTIRLTGAKGEYEPFQLIVSGHNEMLDVKIENLRLVFSDLQSKVKNGSIIPGENINYRVVRYVDLLYSSGSMLNFDDPGWSGETPDELAKSDLFVCQRGKNTVLWITVKVPSDAQPGDYTGKINLFQGGDLRDEVSLEFYVYNFSIPEERHFAAWLPPSRGYARQVYGRTKLNLLWNKYIDNVREHRSSMMRVCPRITFEGEEMHIDYSGFDRNMELNLETLKSPVVCCRVFRIGGGHKLKDTVWGKASEILTPAWRKRYEKAARSIYDHIKSRGWEDNIIFDLYDEPPSKDITYVADCAKILKRAYPGIKLTYWGQSYDPRLIGLINVWTTGYSQFGYLKAKELQKAGDQVWVYNPRYAIDTQAMSTRLIYWRMWHDRLNGLFQWTTTAWVEWTGSKTLWDFNRGASWIYPGEDGPIDTIRWELTREGLEDYEYLWLLRECMRQIEKKGLAREYSRDLKEGKRLLNRVNELIRRKGRLLEYNKDAKLLYELRDDIGRQVEKLSHLVKVPEMAY